jgi:hypothetical protein
MKAQPNQVVVVCSDWVTKPMTAEKATAWKARAEERCNLEHRIEFPTPELLRRCR